MAAVLWLAGQIMPVSLAWILALIARLLVTGCLHEDGLADFFDGFGGGTTRERTLAIMKDSHIGSYGVIGLICYFLLLLQLHHLPLGLLCILVLSGDCWSKFCASQIVNYLPYARKEEDSKSKTVYNRMSRHELLAGFLCGLLPFVLLLPIKLWIATLFPLLTFFLLYRLMKRRLQGYTGDCCGATFLLCELSFYLGSLILIINSSQKLKMEVILIRHTSVDVPPGVCYGQTDVPLKPTFEAEAAVTAENLKAYLPFDHVYTSPLTRCVRLATYCGYPDAERDKRIMEINFGDWEMKPFEQNEDPRLQEWYADYINVAATGGESFAMQYRRVSQFLDELKKKPYTRVAIFAHGGVLICAQLYAGILKAEEAFDALTPYGGIVRINLDKE